MNTVFFDRDGVINEVVLRAGVVSSPRSMAEFKLRPDFVSAFSKIEQRALNIFVVSNQPDVSRGLLDADVLGAMTALLQEQFKFNEVVYCLHDNEDQCLCRKPKPGMLTYLIDKYSLDPDKALFVGDSAKDVMAGAAAGVRTVFLRQEYNRNAGCNADFEIDSLAEFLPLI